MNFYSNLTTLRSGLCYRKSVCRLSVVCNVRAPYSGGWNFRQYFLAILYLSHPLTSVQNFTAIVPGGLKRKRGIATYATFGYLISWWVSCIITIKRLIIINHCRCLADDDVKLGGWWWAWSQQVPVTSSPIGHIWPVSAMVDSLQIGAAVIVVFVLALATEILFACCRVYNWLRRQVSTVYADH